MDSKRANRQQAKELVRIWREIGQYDNHTLRLFAAHRSSLRRNKLIRPRQPSISNNMTELLVVALASQLFGSYGKRGGGSDVTLDSGASVEVKGTGSSAFQEFLLKDLNADYLVWVHYGTRYEIGEGDAIIYMAEKAIKSLTPGKLFLRDFVSNCDDVKAFRFTLQGRVCNDLGKVSKPVS